MTNRSTYLVATPTWAEGAGRLMDFGDSLTDYNYAGTPQEADWVATYQDWSAVGDDILAAGDRLHKEIAS